MRHTRIQPGALQDRVRSVSRRHAHRLALGRLEWMIVFYDLLLGALRGLERQAMLMGTTNASSTMAVLV
ncbi:hypothetical protein L227DRAFT_100955 [Lentinus tigrinus ALCF2SS1-6]|uniref:Uncharacterized protein n=1 Tax=Lentinus tigrinus ALCF2SS1-6 TaxID=1328759 RepID=A0A5C2S997_9APHY|nr:hypothetical protein L227DRAFT_100955 [Lentinus tigrinus ALCF2SS1-6]